MNVVVKESNLQFEMINRSVLVVVLMRSFYQVSDREMLMYSAAHKLVNILQDWRKIDKS